ncbi:MAG: alpha-galactosidase [Fimbriimonas sp.]
MRSRTVVGLLLACAAAPAIAARPTASEARAFAAWTRAAFGFAKGGRGGSRLLPSAVRFPFSAVVDGRRFPEEKGAGWRQTASAKTLPGGTVERAVRWSQAETGLQVTCRIWKYADFPAAEWRLEFENRGPGRSPLIENVQSLDLETSPLVTPAKLLHARGDVASVDSFAPLTDALDTDGTGVQLGPDTGRSSDRDLPFFDLTTPTEGLLVGIGWSGSWQGSVERRDGRASLRAGMRATHFRLEPGEKVRMPSILLLYHVGGAEHRGTNLLRSLLLTHYLPRQKGRLVMPPICATVSQTDPNGSYEGPHLRPIPAMAKWGFEALWSDMDPQHWYPGEFPGGTGNWFPDPVKYPRGLGPIGKATRANGMDYLLWFEPERAAPGSDLFGRHPDWLIKGPWAGGHALVRMGDPEVRKGMLDILGRQASEAGVDWMRLDMNIERPASFWASQDTPERVGLTEAHYVEGWYAFLDALKRAYPHLKLDLCTAGGHRLDFESLRRGLPLWITDMHGHGSNPPAMMLHNGGLSRWIPLFGMPAFGREPSIAFRAALTAGNLYVGFSPEALMACSPADQATLAESVRVSKSLRPNFLGDFYELLPHRAGTDWYGYQFHREESGGGMAVVFHPAAGAASVSLTLRGIDPRKDYDVQWHSGKRRAKLTGRELSALRFDLSVGDSEIVAYSPVPAARR